MTNNANINADPRHQGFSACADGVPFFKDRNAANGWPVALFPESAPPNVARDPAHAHMVALVPSEFLEEDEHGVMKIRKK